MILDQARTGRGTVLTPGCNTPLEMYRYLGPLAGREGIDLPELLMGRRGDFHLGMIDGVEWTLEHPYSFPYYFSQYFLRYLGLPSLCARTDPAEKRMIIEHAFKIFKNVFVPWMPKEATLDEKMAQVYKFYSWLENKLPIDLIVCGIGPDGHIAFLGKGQQRFLMPANRVKLWREIREWKWGNPSDESCICRKVGEGDKCEIPEHALTINVDTFLNARRVVLMATGDHKAEAVKRLLKGPYDYREFVAQYLWEVGGEVTVLLDHEAASLI